jgi:hypothetical protein
MPIPEFEANIKSHDTDTYLIGLASGLNTANSALKLNKNPPLYCLPPFLKLSASNYKEIVSLGIKDVPASRPDRGSMDIDGILLKKLIELYPCGYN